MLFAPWTEIPLNAHTLYRQPIEIFWSRLGFAVTARFDTARFNFSRRPPEGLFCWKQVADSGPSVNGAQCRCSCLSTVVTGCWRWAARRFCGVLPAVGGLGGTRQRHRPASQVITSPGEAARGPAARRARLFAWEPPKPRRAAGSQLGHRCRVPRSRSDLTALDRCLDRSGSATGNYGSSERS